MSFMPEAWVLGLIGAISISGEFGGKHNHLPAERRW
jgi:hypothetical protein